MNMNMKEMSHQDFLESFGPVKAKSVVQEEKSKLRKMSIGAIRVIRSVSLKRTPQINRHGRRTTISTPELATQNENTLEKEKTKLLTEVLAQRTELMKEQKVLEELIKKSQKSASMKAKTSSNYSLYSSDLGYGSAIDEEDEIFSSQSDISKPSTPAVNAEIMAEIEVRRFFQIRNLF